MSRVKRAMGNCPLACDDDDPCTSDVLNGDSPSCTAECVFEPIDGCVPPPPPECGNGVIEEGETCDGSCPADCNDGNACTFDAPSGSSTTCDLSCSNTLIVSCFPDDGCCPSDCTPDLDSDCSLTCGNGLIDEGEICDGNCPAECNDANSCTTDTLTGNPTLCSSACIFEPISLCLPDDNCCPSGCTAELDNDCSATCGDGTVDENETCDGNCLTSCDDQNACTYDQTTGSAENCSFGCSYSNVVECANDDGCCPNGCGSDNDNDCSPTCGNGIIEGSELCDGDCPEECADSNVCTLDQLAGSPETCTASCTFSEILECIHDDGCCPISLGCSSLDDNDCSPQCGNGVLEEGEICDGACPSTCEDNDSCTIDILEGAIDTCSAECDNQPITLCIDGDGCCAPDCNSLDDDDCEPVCGNNLLEAGELCDGNCPADCVDGIGCTADVLVGSPEECNVTCTFPLITSCTPESNDGCCAPECNSATDLDCSSSCGNNVSEVSEVCDGDCPQVCQDGRACTTDFVAGSITSCSASCGIIPVTECVSGDGCCAPGCKESDDSDCTSTCLNGVVEPGETCDGNCPESCSDFNSCTVDYRVGGTDECSVECSFTEITECYSGDSCCPAGCSDTTDTDCSSSCGNSTVEVGETCDGDCPETCEDQNSCTVDLLTGSSEQCSVACSNTQITACIDEDGCCPTACTAFTDSDCSPTCGNGVLEPNETCDGNCPESCDDGIVCTADAMTGSVSQCSALCSFVTIAECINGDGCCAGGCHYNNDDDCAPVCGNGVVEGGRRLRRWQSRR